ncbi:MAG: serine/threonine protein kinase [Planctomycetes bacterium]|nr:serine/threonine protein kinase [Planctomycetota bacterium]
MRLNWTVHYHQVRRLGSGGQGVVYLTQQMGTDGFTVPVALKIFDPGRYHDARTYDEAMGRIATVSARVAQINQDNLLDVQHFVDRDRIRMLVMEWIDGFDLRQMLCNQTFQRVRERVSARRWDYINNVIATSGPEQPRFKPGVAVAIVRECLAALAALHRENIVHGDVKPSNVMLKRTGTAKIIDIGSAFDQSDPPVQQTCTPMYAAPEVLQSMANTPRSDLASLGYVLVEMLSGRQPFKGLSTYPELLAAKLRLPQELPQILPKEVTCNELLMSFCKGLIAPDPTRRFLDADAAALVKEGAAAFLRQLVKGDMSSEYENEIRLLIEELREMEGDDEEPQTR